MKELDGFLKNSGLVKRAYEVSQKAHSGQKRKNGEPYFNHCVAVAQTIADLGLDEVSVAAALLHDVAEDTGYPIEKIRENFGEEVAFLVDGVTKISRIKYRGVEVEVENLRKMILALSQDLRVIFIKLADRLHNVRTLGALPLQKQKRVALETMEIYAPLAYRLGMQNLSGELEDLSFKYIYPQEHKWLLANVRDRYEEREKYLEQVKPALLAELKLNGLEPLSIESRAKRYASLYKKLLRYDMDIEKIYDLVAMRVIMGSVPDCYAVLGVVHKLWPPLPGRIKDYIALPKPNGYRSLHTTVFCLDNKIIEIQIRTRDMHMENENGIAAHWVYDGAKGSKNYAARQATFADKKELAWVNQLKAWQQHSFSRPEEFLQSLKIDFFKDRIFAVTPRGEVIDLPVGATPVDFAYQIHSDIGNECVGARVNGKIVPLDYELHSGDIIEIMTQKNKKPSASWLDFLKTSNARHHVKSQMRKNSKTFGVGGAFTANLQSEIRLLVSDKAGLFESILGIIKKSRSNIVSSASKQNSQFVSLNIRSEVRDRKKFEEALRRVGKMKEVRKVDYRYLY